MSLDSARLKTAIVSKLTALENPPDTSVWEPMLLAIAEAVVEEITVHAVVNPTSLLDSVPAAVTGTGTIS